MNPHIRVQEEVFPWVGVLWVARPVPERQDAHGREICGEGATVTRALECLCERLERG